LGLLNGLGELVDKAARTPESFEEYLLNATYQRIFMLA
jgi:hypothetical protein